MRLPALALLPIFFSASSFGACPKTKKEWIARGPKLLLERAATRNVPPELTDFARKPGNSLQGSARPFTRHKENFVLVETKDKARPLFLSGVLKCDPRTQEPVLMSLTWVSGDKSGIVPLPRQQ